MKMIQKEKNLSLIYQALINGANLIFLHYDISKNHLLYYSLNDISHDDVKTLVSEQNVVLLQIIEE